MNIWKIPRTKVQWQEEADGTKRKSSKRRTDSRNVGDPMVPKLIHAFFTWSIDSNANLKNTHSDTPRNILPANCVSIRLVKLTSIINYH